MGEKFDTHTGVGAGPATGDATEALKGLAWQEPPEDRVIGERNFDDGYTIRRYSSGRVELEAPGGDRAHWVNRKGWVDAEGAPMPAGWGEDHTVTETPRPKN